MYIFYLRSFQEAFLCIILTPVYLATPSLLVNFRDVALLTLFSTNGDDIRYVSIYHEKHSVDV